MDEMPKIYFDETLWLTNSTWSFPVAVGPIVLLYIMSLPAHSHRAVAPSLIYLTSFTQRRVLQRTSRVLSANAGILCSHCQVAVCHVAFAFGVFLSFLISRVSNTVDLGFPLINSIRILIRPCGEYVVI